MAEPRAAPLCIEVAYALPRVQTVLELEVPPGTTCRTAIGLSGILDRHPDIDLEQMTVGIYGELAELDTQVADGDRVEIYRPLQMDPREQRRRRLQARGGARR